MYYTISTLSNGVDHSSLTYATGQPSTTSNTTNNRAIFAGGSTGWGFVGGHNTIQYLTITSTSSAADFGDLITSRGKPMNGVSNGTNERAVFAGGVEVTDGPTLDSMEYITISTTGNASDFGDLYKARAWGAAEANA